MDRRRLESLSTRLAVVLVAALCATTTIAFADLFFDWDLLTGFVEKLAGFLIAAMSTALVGALALSVVLNLSRLAALLDPEPEPDRRGRRP